jgi:hypothetical protein
MLIVLLLCALLALQVLLTNLYRSQSGLGWQAAMALPTQHIGESSTEEPALQCRLLPGKA